MDEDDVLIQNIDTEMHEAILIAFPKTTTILQIVHIIDDILNEYSVHKEVEEHFVMCAYCPSDKTFCTTCKGTGITYTTDNPKARWDWWELGGAWDNAFLQLEPNVECAPFNANIFANLICTEQLAKQELFVTTVIDHEGNLTDVENITDPTVICKKYPDHFFVVMDCHS
jgi:hypothetical protein